MKKKRERVRALCRRCEQPFGYLRCARFRYYCRPCVKLEAKDANKFFNALTSANRRAEREQGAQA